MVMQTTEVTHLLSSYFYAFIIINYIIIITNLNKKSLQTNILRVSVLGILHSLFSTVP